jgi:RND family efflux transporter MFP subunit
MPDNSLSGSATLALPRCPAPRPPRIWLGFVGGAALLAALGAAVAPRLVGGPAPAPLPVLLPETPPALTVVLAPATERQLVRPVIGDGSVVAWQELVVGIELGGFRVVEVPFEEGDQVRRGQILARIEDAVLAAQAAAAEAAVVEAEAAQAIAQSDLRRSAELARSESVARQTLEQRQSAARQAEARLLAARARRDEAAARLAQTRILAPADGVITRRGILPGAVAQPGQEVARLVRDGRLELDARVPELDLAEVRPGQPVRVRHGEQEITARVRALAPVVGSDNRLGVVHIALPPESGLRPGMFAQAEILREARPALTVPQEAVVFREGRPAVFLLPEGSDRVQLRPVRTGDRRGGEVEVVEGLAAGERVVARGAGFLTDGDRVSVAAPR